MRIKVNTQRKSPLPDEPRNLSVVNPAFAVQGRPAYDAG
jgi:hypothetical protein